MRAAQWGAALFSCFFFSFSGGARRCHRRESQRLPDEPAAASYTPGTIARGHFDKRTYQRTGEKLLKLNMVRCRAPFDKDGFEENLDGALFFTHDQKSFGLSAGWANILNASFSGSYVSDVSLTFSGTIYEYPEDKLKQLRRSYLGSSNPKSDENKFQFQIVRLAVGRFEYKVNFNAG